jgi:6,7-dimethyl-8-ribityllumazine synthase
MEQALERAGGNKGNKGADAVDTALLMYRLTQKIKEQS